MIQSFTHFEMFEEIPIFFIFTYLSWYLINLECEQTEPDTDFILLIYSLADISISYSWFD